MEFFFIYLVFGIISIYLVFFVIGLIDWTKTKQPEKEEPTIDPFKLDSDSPTPSRESPKPVKRLKQDTLLAALSTSKRQEFVSNFRIHLAEYLEKRNLSKSSVPEEISWPKLELFLGHHSSEDALEDSLVNALGDEFCKRIFNRFKREQQLSLMEIYIREFPSEILDNPKTVEGGLFGFISKIRDANSDGFSEETNQSVDNVFCALLEKQSGFRFMLENDQLDS